MRVFIGLLPALTLLAQPQQVGIPIATRRFDAASLQAAASGAI
jgi:hypothetical protein